MLSLADVAARTGLSARTVKRLVAAGTLASVKIAGRRLVSADALDALARSGGDAA